MAADAQFDWDYNSQYAALRADGEVALYFDLNKDGTGYVNNGSWHFSNARLVGGGIELTVDFTKSEVFYPHVIKNPKRSS